MYLPANVGLLEVDVGGGSYEVLSDLTDISQSHNQPEASPAQNSIDPSVPAQAPSIGDPTPGTVTATITPEDISAASKAVQAAFFGKSNASVRVNIGRAREVADSASTTSITGHQLAVTAATRILTLSGGGSFGASDAQPTAPYMRGQVAVIGAKGFHAGPWLSTTTRRTSLIGDVAGNVLTPSTDALEDVVAGDFKLYEYIIRLAGNVRVLAGGDLSVAQAGASSTIILQWNTFPTKDYLLANPSY